MSRSRARAFGCCATPRPEVARTQIETGDGSASRLEKSPEGGLDRIAWKSVGRRAPNANEIEVEVVATGLNFRDVMWALSILPDEMLEDGFAGPTLGLEFSGRVTQVGSSVEHLKVGDPVVGLCGGAFATHVVVDVEHVAKVPRVACLRKRGHRAGILPDRLLCPDKLRRSAAG